MGINFDKLNPDEAQKIINALKDGRINDAEMEKLGLTKAEQEELNKAFSSGEVMIGDFVLTNKGKTEGGKKQISTTRKLSDAEKYEKEYEKYMNEATEEYNRKKTKTKADMKQAIAQAKKDWNDGNYFDSVINYGKGFVDAYKHENLSKPGIQEAGWGKALIAIAPAVATLVLTSCSPDEGPEFIDNSEVNISTGANVTVTVKKEVTQVINTIDEKALAEAINTGLASFLEPFMEQVLAKLDGISQQGAVAIEFLTQIAGRINYDLPAIMELLEKWQDEYKINEENKAQLYEALIEQLKENNTLVKELKEQNTLDNKAIIELLTGLQEQVQELKDVVRNYPEYTEQLNAIIAGINNGNVGIKQLQSMLNELIKQVKTNNSMQAYELGILENMLEVLKNVDNTTQEINAKLDKVIGQLEAQFQNDTETLEYLKQIKEAIVSNGDKIDSTNKLLEQLMAQDKELQKEVLQYIAAVGFDMNVRLSELLETGNKNADDIKALLAAMNDNIIAGNAQNAKYGEAILEAINKLGAENAKNFTTLIQAVKDNKLTLEEMKVALDLVNANIVKGNKDSQEMGNQLLQYIAAVGFDMNMRLSELMEYGKTHTNEVKELLTTINNNVIKGNEQNEKYANAILEALGELGTEYTASMTTLVNAVKAGNLSLDELKAAVDMVKDKVAEGNETVKAAANQILQYIAAVGYDMNVKLTAILDAIKNGNVNGEKVKELLEEMNAVLKDIKAGGAEFQKSVQNLFARVLDKMDTMDANQQNRAKELLEAIKNIKVTGGTVDLTSVNAMLNELIELTKVNNGLLTELNAKEEVLMVTTKSIEEKLEAQGHKNDKAHEVIITLLGEIKNNQAQFDDTALMKKLDVITANFDEILKKLDEIKDLIKDHKVEVTVNHEGTITCNCNCGQPHEGVLGDLNDLLNNKQ